MNKPLNDLGLAEKTALKVFTEPNSLIIFHDPIEGTTIHFGPAMSGIARIMLSQIFDSGIVKEPSELEALKDVLDKISSDSDMIERAREDFSDGKN